jgi:soluble lytic murein transglycosylase-like protein
MQRTAILVVCACVASSALAADARRGPPSNGSYQTASAADMSALESAARVSVWPVIGAMRDSSSPPAPVKDSSQAIADTKSSGQAACGNRVDADALKALVWKDAKALGVDPQLALTILSLESNDGQALNSDRGARGPMQLTPSTAARYGVSDICNPEQNVRGGLLFLKDLVEQFQGNMMLVAAAYNAGPERVYSARGVPAITETVRYVANAANKYYGLNVFATRRKRAAVAPRPAEGPVVVAEAAESDPTAQHPRQEWIGGSVLYVGDGERP